MDRNDVLEQVLTAADRSWPAYQALPDPHRTAALVMDEVASRTGLFDGPETAVTAQFALRMPPGEDLGELGYTLTVGPGGTAVSPGWADDSPITISQDLAELVHAVYGPVGLPYDATRELVILDEPGPETDDPADPWLAHQRQVMTAAGQIVSACSPHRCELGGLARKFGSDKWGGQLYTPKYEIHFARYRDRRVRLLEIGVGGFEDPHSGGESLRMWKHYFRRGMVYGLDIFDKSPIDEPRITTIAGDQADPVFLGELARKIGPLDIVIDDGSHISSHVIAAFGALFPALRPGGMYVIEDLQTSYWPGWNGGRTDLEDTGTSVGFLKTLVDLLHHQDQLRDGPYQPSDLERNLFGVHFYHNMVFLEKGLNGERTAPTWVRRQVNDMDLTPKGSMRRAAVPTRPTA